MAAIPTVTVRNKTSEQVLMYNDANQFALVPPSAQQFVVQQQYTFRYDATKIQVISGTSLQQTDTTPPGSGVFPTTIPAYSVLVSQGTPNVFETVTLTDEYDIIIRKDGVIKKGNLQQIITDMIVSGNLGDVVNRDEKFNATPGSLVVGTIAFLPIINSVELYLNGLNLEEGTDWALVGKTISISGAYDQKLGGDGTGSSLKSSWVFAVNYQSIGDAT